MTNPNDNTNLMNAPANDKEKLIAVVQAIRADLLTSEDVERVAGALRDELSAQRLDDPDFISLAIVAIRSARGAPIPEDHVIAAAQRIQAARYIGSEFVADARVLANAAIAAAKTAGIGG